MAKDPDQPYSKVTRSPACILSSSHCVRCREVFLPGQDAPVAISDLSLHARLKPEEPARNKISEGHKPGASYTMLSLPVLHPVPHKHSWRGQAGLDWGEQSPPSPNPPMCCIPSPCSTGWASFLGKFEKPPSSHCHLQRQHIVPPASTLGVPPERWQHAGPLCLSPTWSAGAEIMQWEHVRVGLGGRSQSPPAPEFC